MCVCVCEDSHVPPTVHCPQSHCPSHSKVPLGLWNVLETPVSHQRHHSPRQESPWTMGCPQDPAVPPETSQSHCPSRPKVLRGLWDVLRTLVSHKRHHSPFPSQSPLGTLEFGMSSGFRCPTTYITVPLSFPSQNPLWEVLRNFTTIRHPVVNHMLIAKM